MRFVLLLLLLIPCISIAQKKKKQRDTSAIISQPNRLEFELKNDRSDFYVVSGDSEGLLVVEETGIPVKGGGFQWILHKVDTAFDVVSTKTYEIPADGSLLGYEYFGGRYYLLFNKSRYKGNDFIVYQLNSATNEFISYEITTVFPVDIAYFESVGETLLIGGYANFRPVVITYNINDQKPKVVPGFYDTKNDMLDLVVDQNAQLFTVIMTEKMRNKKLTIRVKTFTEEGDLIQENLIDPGDKKSLLDAASTTFSNGLQYLAGTHSKKSPLYSQGFYLSKFINGSQQFNKYYPFAELNNFFSHLKPKREQRIKNRIERKRDRGKTKRFNYRLLVHEILQRGEEFIMIAEAYYPRYNYGNTGTSYNPFATASRYRGYQPFDPNFLGYKYTHAVVIGFDRNCNIIWDNTFKIEDIQQFALKKNVIVTPIDNKITLTYLEENEIRSKVIEGNEIVEGRTFNPVKLTFQADEVKSKDPGVEGIEKWYNETLYAYGIQSIKNESGVAGKITRKVFYLNKIQFEFGKELN